MDITSYKIVLNIKKLIILISTMGTFNDLNNSKRDITKLYVNANEEKIPK